MASAKEVNPATVVENEFHRGKPSDNALSKYSVWMAEEAIAVNRSNAAYLDKLSEAEPCKAAEAEAEAAVF